LHGDDIILRALNNNLVALSQQDTFAVHSSC